MQKNIIIGAALVVVFGGFGLYVLKNQRVAVPATTTIPPATKIQETPAVIATNPVAPVAQNAVKAPAVNVGVNATNTKVTMGTVLGTNGSVGDASTTFAPTTKVIYAGLTVKNVTTRTKLSYVRYYNGKYVDSKVSHPSKDGVPYFHFAWTLNPGQTRKTGNYSLAFYVNGKKTQTATYTLSRATLR